jgi:vacuole morphology and inheritance protein 14
LKDIMAEYATTFTSAHGPTGNSLIDSHEQIGLGFEKPFDPQAPAKLRKAFSLSRLIPLLSERIHVLNPFTRNFIISWLQLLDSVPDLQLITFLPSFFEGLLRYLSDPTAEVKVATEGLLESMLREVRDCREVELEKRRRKWEWDKMREERRRVRRLMNQSKERQKIERRASEAKTVRQGNEGKSSMAGEDGVNLPEADEHAIADDEEEDEEGSIATDDDSDAEDPTEWQPGEGVEVDYAAIVSILVRHLDAQGDLGFPLVWKYLS